MQSHALINDEVNDVIKSTKSIMFRVIELFPWITIITHSRTVLEKEKESGLSRPYQHSVSEK